MDINLKDQENSLLDICCLLTNFKQKLMHLFWANIIHLPGKFLKGQHLINDKLMMNCYKLYELDNLLFLPSQTLCKIDDKFWHH